MSEQFRALYPELGRRRWPTGPQQHEGAVAARAALLGGSSKGAGLQLWQRVAQAKPGPRPAGASSSSAAGSVGPPATAAGAPGAALGAALAAPGPTPSPPPPPPLEFLDDEHTEAQWGEHRLHLYQGAVCTHYAGTWWTLCGPGPQHGPFDPAQHWWERWDP